MSSSASDLNSNKSNSTAAASKSSSLKTIKSGASSEDPRSTTLNYEYQEQPTVKLNLSPSELEFLEDDDKSQLTQSSASSLTITEKPDRNGNRFIASVSILISLGLLGIGLNALYSKTNFFLSLMVIFFSLLIYEWNRIHGLTLSRKLRPVFNMSSVFATYKHLDPDMACLYGADKDKYYKWACCNVPELNSDLPRTSDEKSPPNSPPKAEAAATNKSKTTTEKAQKSSRDSDQQHSEPLEAMKPKNGVEVKLSLPPETFKEL
uniref:Uncharacterized protein n=1 Tax=Panagrolaimus sp. PS1159 TaxID=55785 RepID=A0AC35GAG5_9BILA